MSIKALALELYRAQQKVGEIQKAIEAATHMDKEKLQHKLKAASQELKMLRRMLDGEKEAGSFRKKFSGFGRLT